MASRKILAEHPSVQDLEVHTSGVNNRKVAYNNYIINAGPLTSAAHPRTAKKEAKGQTTTVTRHEENLIYAANRPRSDVNYAATGSGSSSKLRKPPLAPSGNSNHPPVGLVLGASSSSSKASSKPSSLYKKKNPLTADRLPQLPSGGRRKLPSVVTSVESFEGTDAESYTEYSCSCCAIRPPSSVPTGRAYSHVPSGVPSSAGNYTDSVLDAYENMTSISQRIANQNAKSRASAVALGGKHHSQGGSSRRALSSIGGTSVASTKLRELESQLAQERQDRQKTQEDLKAIQERQVLLMSKLSQREKERFDDALNA